MNVEERIRVGQTGRCAIDRIAVLIQQRRLERVGRITVGIGKKMIGQEGEFERVDTGGDHEAFGQAGEGLGVFCQHQRAAIHTSGAVAGPVGRQLRGHEIGMVRRGENLGDLLIAHRRHADAGAASCRDDLRIDVRR